MGNRKIIAYLDFDGTLTGKAGKDTVNSARYKNLLANDLPYHKATFVADLNELVKAADFPREFKITPNAKQFLNFLANMKNVDVEIVIISKNRREYIEAVLQAQFKNNLFEKLQIIDVNNLAQAGNKEAAIVQYETNHSSNVDTIKIICDDSAEDYALMCRALESHKNKICMQQPTGKFEFFDTILEIDAKLKQPTILEDKLNLEDKRDVQTLLVNTWNDQHSLPTVSKTWAQRALPSFDQWEQRGMQMVSACYTQSEVKQLLHAVNTILKDTGKDARIVESRFVKDSDQRFRVCIDDCDSTQLRELLYSDSLNVQKPQIK